MKKDKRINNDLQNITQKLKAGSTRTPLKTGGELKCTGMVGYLNFICCTRRVTLVMNPVISHK